MRVRDRLRNCNSIESSSGMSYRLIHVDAGYGALDSVGINGSLLWSFCQGFYADRPDGGGSPGLEVGPTGVLLSEPHATCRT